MKKSNLDLKRALSLLIISFLVLNIGSAFIRTATGEEGILDRGISIEIEDEDQKEEVFVNVTEEFRINIGGSFEFKGQRVSSQEADNWSLEVETAADATVQPEEQSSNTTNQFTFEVMFRETGKANLNFTAYCRKENETRYLERQFKVRVVEANTVSFEVDNPNDSELEEIKLKLYIDDELRNTKTIRDMGPEETHRVKFNWSRHGLDSGEHELEVRADYGFGREKVLLSDSFYVEGETNTALYGGIAAASIGGAVVIYLIYRRKKRRRRRPW
ncbi:MAG: CARDB domain-containing protein [Candidatus Thermoplasmatota archaeon]